ncbi:MAG: T9SS type A sorting domain-containing protein [Bacteroidales bacterium]|nr:T9SS type A sorting domain-containing protein [Bacteroidales bacterium]
MPENEYAQVKKVNEYERLKSKIHIGDSYSDIKAKLPSVMTLYDVQGRKMLEMKANSESEKIFVGDLPRGIYMLRVANAGGTTLHKVILE